MERERGRERGWDGENTDKGRERKTHSRQRQGGKEKYKYLQATLFSKSLLLAFRLCPVCHCLYKQQNQYGHCSDPGAGGAHQWIHLQKLVVHKGHSSAPGKDFRRDTFWIRASSTLRLLTWCSRLVWRWLEWKCNTVDGGHVAEYKGCSQPQWQRVKPESTFSCIFL